MKKERSIDLSSIIHLIVLYTVQGIPTGLAFGSIPFIIQKNASYTDIGVFSLAAYPYTFKLLWSPIVDSIHFKKFGLRKSWIVPMQLCAGLLFLYMSTFAEELTNGSHANIKKITILFFLLILFMATQDIAVDGWALTMLKKTNVTYASTCQTIGLNIGYFSTLNSPEFCNSYIRSVPSDSGLISLSGYLRFWGIFYVLLTLYVALFKDEEQVREDHAGIITAYKRMVSILSLPNVKLYAILLLTCRLGFIVSDAVMPLKLVEKGFKKDNLALMVTIAFPFEFLFAVLAGKIASKSNRILDPWRYGFLARLLISVAGVFLVYSMPRDHTLIQPLYYLSAMIVFLLYSLCSNFMFVTQGAFFAKISDERMGGTYITLLNTLSNFGATYPKFFVFYFVEYFTTRTCLKDVNALVESTCGADTCLVGEKCSILYDGYYYVSMFCIVLGVALYVMYTPILNRIQSVPSESWTIKEEMHHDP
ncbi:MFS transporter, PAT family, solute carrier family 33 [Acrasis kona]|uniref:MFS transporter, PAT family, solute carrier family 33 n=1 Tax=Acrasis kona TaxID=1008807 RepID=A0AAW2YJE8_9EUKA